MILLVIVFIIVIILMTVLVYTSSSCDKKSSENFETVASCNKNFKTCEQTTDDALLNCDYNKNMLNKVICVNNVRLNYINSCVDPLGLCCYSTGGKIPNPERQECIKNCEATNCCGDLASPCTNFETCNGTSCVLNPGRCNVDTDCPDGSDCNTSTNTCVIASTDYSPGSGCNEYFGKWHLSDDNEHWVCKCHNSSVYDSSKGCSPLINDLLCPQLEAGEVPADVIPSFSKYGWGNSLVLIEKGTEQNPLPTSILCCNGNGKWNPSTQKCDCYVQTTPSFDDHANKIDAPIGTWYGNYCEQGTNICTDPAPCNAGKNRYLPKSDACKLCGDTDPCLLPGEATPGKARVWRERSPSRLLKYDKYCCTTQTDCETPPKKCEVTHNCCGDLDLPCKNFEQCDGTKCIVNPGRCYIGTDCPNGSECNTSTNTCVVAPPNYCNDNGVWNPSTQKCDCYIQTTPNFDGTNPAIGTWYGDHCERDTNICTNPEPCNDVRNNNLPKSSACSLCVENKSCLLPDKSTLGKIFHEIPTRIHQADKYCCTTGTSCL